ncbi:hypothetical protein [Streptomyces albipurpureus]|uniref:Uncharacterized protein n=1 Tax=Streptomyces albipurpureus TaxID=2897419 RepID=A0ABT0UIJ8_9ACTN|nr:hypothetical protein [Streptomyces sp. CWNU-1]MCM2388468.1 hypothetical protein [Streptomyces sp. CWNU-1]
MRRARPGDAPRGNGGVPNTRRSAGDHTRGAAGEERALTSVEAGADFDGDGSPERAERTIGAVAGTEAGAAAETETARGGYGDEQSKLWHITLSVSGAEAPLKEVRRGLEQLAHDHPFLLTSRYASDHAEIRYWEEARDLHDAAAVALRLWGEHRSTSRLPPWTIVGLEVIDRQTYHQRVAEGYGPPPASSMGAHPF